MMTAMPRMNSHDPYAERLAALRWFGRPPPGKLSTPGEHINDELRLLRALELMNQGMRKHPAARQACREDLAGQSEEACERRVVRKLAGRLDPKRLP